MVSQRTADKRDATVRQRTRAKAMRHKQTEAERLFWERVRAHRLNGYKFKRQYLIGAYTADLICIDRKLIVELDGGIHLLKVERDRLRDAIISTRGYRVLRFENWQVAEKLDDVLRTVLHYLENSDQFP